MVVIERVLQGVVANDVDYGTNHVGLLPRNAVQEGLQPTYRCQRWEGRREWTDPIREEEEEQEGKGEKRRGGGKNKKLALESPNTGGQEMREGELLLNSR